MVGIVFSFYSRFTTERCLSPVGTGDPSPNGVWRLPALSMHRATGQNPFRLPFGQKNVAKIYRTSPT